MKKAVKIIFFGTPEFARIILERLINSEYKPILVVTASDKPVGRKQIMTPPPVKISAEQHNIPVIQPQKLSAATILKPSGSDPDGLRIGPRQVDLIIVAAYGKIIPKEILNIPKYGALNVHPSLLPRWRGPSPIQYTILNGDKETGATIMLMDEKLDHGPVLTNFQFSIFPPAGDLPKGDNFQLTTDELSKKIAKIGAELLIETIPKWIEGKIKPKEQNHKNATYSKILTKKDGYIDWSKSAEEIERQIRAFTSWPGSFTFWKNRRIKIIKGAVEVKPQRSLRFNLNSINPNVGQVFLHKENQLAAQTGKGIFIIEKLQLEGKNEMSAKQFLNGYSHVVGETLK